MSDRLRHRLVACLVAFRGCGPLSLVLQPFRHRRPGPRVPGRRRRLGRRRQRRYRRSRAARYLVSGRLRPVDAVEHALIAGGHSGARDLRVPDRQSVILDRGTDIRNARPDRILSGAQPLPDHRRSPCPGRHELDVSVLTCLPESRRSCFPTRALVRFLRLDSRRAQDG